jgi:hypothetical protein
MEDAKLRQALKSELSSFVRDSSQELSCRIRRNLESNFLLDPQRLEELSQNGLLDAIVDQCRSDMQGLIEEFLSGSCNPQSRTPTPLVPPPRAMDEDSGVALPVEMAGVEFDLPVDGEGVAAHWQSEVPPGDGFLPSTSSGDDLFWPMDTDRFWRAPFEFNSQNVI